MVDLETPERGGLRQCTTFGDILVQQHRGRGVEMGGRGSPGCAPVTPLV
jgi:hypothetical protein